MNDPAVPAPEHRKRRRHRRGGGPRGRAWLSYGVAALLAVAVVGAPLACGAVHRPVLLPLLGALVALAAATAVLAALKQADLPLLPALILPVLFLVIALAQIVPIPAALRALLDPKGSELLALAHLTGAQPLSLDPPETYLRLAHATAALAVGLAALVLGTSRRTRFVAPGLIAVAGLAALVIGLGHRAVSVDKIYGLFGYGRGLPIGPFINPNHTAEFLELAAFAALAFAFSRPSRDGQRVWQIVAAVLAAGAISTLSRGSVLALGSGALAWFLLAPRSDEGEPLHRTRFAGVLIAVLMVAGLALGFGIEGLVGRFSDIGAGREGRFAVWWDALNVVRAHPAGIGLGAFGRVYPVYRTTPATSTVWYQFPENQPLGLLIDTGIPGALLFLGGWALVLRCFAKGARRDRVEASLAAGLIALLAHNLTDFGLETLGILLPFSAMWGALFGRQVVASEAPAARPRLAAVWAGGSAAAVALSITLLLSPSTRDFDKLLRQPLPLPEARATARAAARAHPTDYVYALAEAKLHPTTLEAAPARLSMLNRAMLLCPRCTVAHAEAARDLWRLGRRGQALLEWKTVLADTPGQLPQIFGELAASGAKPAELMSLASDGNRHQLSRLLLGRGLLDAAREVLAGSTQQESADFHLAAAQIALEAKDLGAARAATQRARAAAPRDPRVFLMAADIESRAGSRDQAIDVLTEGLRFEPMDVELNRARLGLLMQTDRWRDTDRALDDFRRALSEHGIRMFDANLAAASIFMRRGQLGRALAEYQAASALVPDHIGVLLSLAHTAEQAGAVTTAIDAYNAALRLSPGQAEASAALARIQRDKKSLQVLGAMPSSAGAGKE